MKLTEFFQRGLEAQQAVDLVIANARQHQQLRRTMLRRFLEDPRLGDGKSYTISEDGKSITCHLCGLTSHHAMDVQERYCGRCGGYHNER